MHVPKSAWSLWSAAVNENTLSPKHCARRLPAKSCCVNVWVTNCLTDSSAVVAWHCSFVGHIAMCRWWGLGYKLFLFGLLTSPTKLLVGRIYTWQFSVEIENYFVAYLDRIALFEAPYHWTSIKGRAHTRSVHVSGIGTSTKSVWVLPIAEAQQYCTALRTQLMHS